MEPMARKPKCPICREEVELRSENEFFPFCSKRCKMEDLGKWLNEEYRMPMSADSTERKLQADQDSGESRD